jgi:hypothetical protein
MKRKLNPNQIIQQYKRQYYEKNNEIYRQRNKIAAEKLTSERLEAFVTDDIIFKLSFILRPENINLW